MTLALRATPFRWQDDLQIACWQAGPDAAPAVVLLHGYPQTHITWSALAALLAPHYRLILPDLRGYGDSIGPAPDPTHAHYSKRAMADDMARLMRALGIGRYAVIGHDRGGRVGHRLALDHPAAVACFTSLTVIPTVEQWQRMNATLALKAYHWLLLAQPGPLPERMLAAAPEAFLDDTLNRMSAGRTVIPPAHRAEYLRCFLKPEVRRAMIEDYRAAASIDLEHDRADQTAGRRVRCPVQVLWEAGRFTADETPVTIWQRWADTVCGAALDCGHLMPEAAPQAVLEQVLPFLRRHLG